MEKGMKKTYQAVYFCNLIQGPYKLNSDSIYMLIAEVKASACNLGGLGSISRSGRSPGEGHGYPLQFSWLENSMDRSPWWGYRPWCQKNPTGLLPLTRDRFAPLGYRKYKGPEILQKLWCQLLSRPHHQDNGPDWNMSQKTLLLRVHFLRVSILLSLQTKKNDGRR